MHSEATVQADVRQLLLTGGLSLGEHDVPVELETQVGTDAASTSRSASPSSR